jgi:hypothetical protein
MKKVTENIVDLAKRLDLDEDVEDLLDSHSDELSNEDLIEL